MSARPSAGPAATVVVRAERTVGALIVGVSYIDTTPYLPEEFAKGRARFGGVDARWMGAASSCAASGSAAGRSTARPPPAATST